MVSSRDAAPSNNKRSTGPGGVVLLLPVQDWQEVRSRSEPPAERPSAATTEQQGHRCFSTSGPVPPGDFTEAFQGGVIPLSSHCPLTRELREDSVRSVRARSRVTFDLHRCCGR